MDEIELDGETHHGSVSGLVSPHLAARQRVANLLLLVSTVESALPALEGGEVQKLAINRACHASISFL